MREQDKEIRKAAPSEVDTAVYRGIRDVLVSARTKAFAAVNTAMVEAYFHIGRQIEEAA